jgi:hydrogenase maturation protease
VNNGPAPSQTDDLLVIGYGNTLRSDDGVGPRVAAAAEHWNLPGVRVIACHQLMPEMAEPVSRARRVVFVDAAVDAPREVQMRPLEPADSCQLLAHAADPKTLLALARDVFGHCPKAWWLTVPIEKLDFGETFSPLAQQGYLAAVEKLRALTGNFGIK